MMSVMGLKIWFMGLVSLLVKRSNFMIILLSFEIMVMGLFMMMLSMMVNLVYEKLIFFLVMIVIESCFMLSMMVILINFYGSDKIDSFNLLNS